MLVTLRLRRRPVRQTSWFGALVAQGQAADFVPGQDWPKRPGRKQRPMSPKPSVQAKTTVNKGWRGHNRAAENQLPFATKTHCSEFIGRGLLEQMPVLAFGLLKV